MGKNDKKPHAIVDTVYPSELHDLQEVLTDFDPESSEDRNRLAAGLRHVATQPDGLKMIRSWAELFQRIHEVARIVDDPNAMKELFTSLWELRNQRDIIMTSFRMIDRPEPTRVVLYRSKGRINIIGSCDIISERLLTIADIIMSIEQKGSTPEEKAEAALRDLLGGIAPERLESLLAQYGYRPIHEPLSQEAIQAINAVIEEINTNPYLPKSKLQDTDFETALNMFKEHGSQGVDPDELKTLVQHVGDPATAVRKLVHRLNGKLEKTGFSIHRPRRYYFVSNGTATDE